MPKYTRAERKRHQEEVRTGTKPEDMREIFLTSKMKAKRKRKADNVRRRLLSGNVVTVTFPDPGMVGPPEISESFWEWK